MSPEQHADDRTLLALFEALEQGADPGELGRDLPAGEAGETLARLYIETLGLLPYALEPLAPSPALRDRILAVATGDDTQEVDRAVLPPLPPLPTPLAAVPPPPVAATPRPVRAAAVTVPEPIVPMAPIPRPARRWPLALAAALILALLGLSGWLYRELEEKSQLLAANQTAIDRLADDLKAERARSAENATLRAELEQVRSRFGEMQQQLSLVTAPTVEMSPLRPTGQVAAARDAHGRIYVAADHQHWYMSVHDLAPSAAGQEYQLWFIGDAGPVSGGTFTGAPGEPMHLSSEHMPAGTKAILITLEPAPGAPAPSGPEVMRAAPPIKVI